MKSGYSSQLSFEKKLKNPLTNPPRFISGTAIRILGCGTSSGVPLLACQCKTCLSKDPRNHRTRASIVIQTGRTVFLVDTSPDLRTQALANDVKWIDATLFSHPHADHLHGIDDLRTFNYIMARPIPCYGNEWTIETIRTRFDYIFHLGQRGGGKPALDLHILNKRQKIKGVWVQPLELVHGSLPVLGYRINDVAYITDCSYIPDRTFKLLKGLNVLVLDCLRFTKHPTHLNVEEAIEVAKKIKAKKTYFTHMGHEIEYRDFAKSLPPKMYPAYDGLLIRSK